MTLNPAILRSIAHCSLLERLQLVHYCVILNQSHYIGTLQYDAATSSHSNTVVTMRLSNTAGSQWPNGCSSDILNQGFGIPDLHRMKKLPDLLSLQYNILPRELAESPSLEVFKSWLEKHLYQIF